MSDQILIVCVLVGIAIITAVLASTLGRSLARRNKILAITVSALCVPAISIVASYVTFYLDDTGAGDGPAMALAGGLIYAAVSLPITLIVSVIMILRGRSRQSE